MKIIRSHNFLFLNVLSFNYSRTIAKLRLNNPKIIAVTDDDMMGQSLIRIVSRIFILIICGTSNFRFSSLIGNF